MENFSVGQKQRIGLKPFIEIQIYILMINKFTDVNREKFIEDIFSIDDKKQ